MSKAKGGLTSELKHADTKGNAADGCNQRWCDPLDPATFCNECGNATTGRRFCNGACRGEFNKRRFPEGFNKRIKTGAIKELLAAADLLKRDYQVFRAEQHDSKVDLIVDLIGAGEHQENALEGRHVLKVEVKTGHLGVNRQGEPTVTLSAETEADRANPPYHILAVVLDGGDVIYYPGPDRWMNAALPKVQSTARTCPYISANSRRDPRIGKVQVSANCSTLRITLQDGTVIQPPVELFPELTGKNLDDLLSVVARSGYVVRWPKLGLEATAEQLFHGQLESAPSNKHIAPRGHEAASGEA